MSTIADIKLPTLTLRVVLLVSKITHILTLTVSSGLCGVFSRQLRSSIYVISNIPRRVFSSGTRNNGYRGLRSSGVIGVSVGQKG